MTDSTDGSIHEQTGNGPSPNPVPPRDVTPSFVCTLPCTKPPVKYLDCLDGCISGIHLTPEDNQDLQTLYGRMADAIDAMLAKDAESCEQAAPDPCVVCLTSIVPSSTSPMLYLENCVHYFHYDCLQKWQETRTEPVNANCPHCRVYSSRALLWPQPFPSDAAKNQIFQLQKRNFGLYLAPKTNVMINKCSLMNESTSFELQVWIEGQGYKSFTLNKRRSPRQKAQNAPGEASQLYPSELMEKWPLYDEADLAFEIRSLHLADNPRVFFLGDILPIEEDPQFQTKYGPLPPLNELSKREKILLQFRCPFGPPNGPPNRDDCSLGYGCEFWHGWPENTPAFIVERVKLRDFPRFFCIKNSRNSTYGPECIINERIQAHSQDLVRCSDGFHPTVEDLKNLDGFASKMAKLIMSPVVVPEQLICALCHKTAEPNSVWIHMQNCVHYFHMNCAPRQSPRNNSNRKFDCSTCHVSSMRTIAWPGAFPSDTVKKAIFERQLEQFMLKVQADTQIEVIELGSGHSQGRPLAKLANIFTVDFGCSNVVIIDAATAPNNSVIWYD